jgi:cytochrome-b5 reductase
MTLALGGLGGLAYYTWATRSGDAILPSALLSEEFISLPLKKVVPYNHNTSTFIFELPKNTSSKLPVASCVVVKAADLEALKDKKGNPVVRPYTPISSADKTGELVFLIKKYDTGVMSKYIHSLKASGPFIPIYFRLTLSTGRLVIPSKSKAPSTSSLTSVRLRS